MDDLPADLRSAIDELRRTRGVHGVAVAAFDADAVRFAGGIGLADVDRGEPVSPSTVFRVASVSKLVTTTLVLRLVQAGHLDLDEPVNRYLPASHRIRALDGGPAPSSLRSVLSHTSGIPFGVRGADLGNPVTTRVANGRRVRNLADAIAGLRLSHPPDEKIVYSNPGFNVLGHVAALAAGTSFEEAVAHEVLGPLGMVDSQFTPRATGPGVATPYGSISPPKVGPRSATTMRLVATPMGGLTTTVLDLARFGQMVLRGGVADGEPFIDPALLDEATTLTATNHPDLEQGYGLGFKVRPWRGRTLVGHDGHMPGVATRFVLSPDDGVGVVVLTNGFALGLAHHGARRALEHLVGDVAPEPEPPSGAPAIEAEALGGRVEGRYRLLDSAPPGLLGALSDRYLRVQLSHEGEGRLRLDGSPGSDGPLRLHPDGPVGRYRVEAAVDDGTNAVLEERADGVHLWLSHTTHLVRRR